jgi:hypothetical protein
LPTLLHCRRRHKLALERVNVHGRHLYVSDFYHTLVNCPWYRFYFLFVFFYICMVGAAYKPGAACCVMRAAW